MNGITPQASVIIPTYNGASKISFLLDSLQIQSFQDIEVIVVVDGSTDDTIEILERYRNSFKHFKVAVQKNAGRARVRNNGFNHSVADIIIFFDDDMILNKNTVEHHILFHTKYPHSLYCGNQVDMPEFSRTDIQNYKAYLSIRWTEKYLPGLNKLDFFNLFFTAANCSLRREEFIKLNGFDERLRDAEDYDLAYRALEMGLPLYFDKDNVAIHQDFISCSSYVGRQIQYKIAHEKLIQLHPQREKNVIRKISGIKKVFYWPFSFPIWHKLIDETSVLKFLPESVRFKLYDWVIFASSSVFPMQPRKEPSKRL
jgi:glycosyltransferase involved in cell wall biosynthesis